MGIIEEIKRMQLEGRPETEVMKALQEKGYAPQEVHDAMSQAKIKEAVTASPAEAESVFTQPANDSSSNNMQPSMLTSQPAEAPAPVPQQQAPAPSYSDYSSSYAAPYQEYAYTGTSADTIAEIAEQVTAEKLQGLRSDIEKIINLKTSFEAKTEYIDERLKRIEKIIDRLQLSILQKVGEHVTNVDDLKKELIETQKTFKALLPQMQAKTQ